MKTLNKINKFHFLISIIVIVFIYLLASSIVQLTALPGILRISPGQEFILSVRYPLSFYQKPKDNLKIKVDRVAKIFTNRLVLNSKNRNRFDVQLRLFGAIPLRKVRVEIADAPMVVPGGQAIGVLFSSTGVVIVGHAPVRSVERKQFHPAREAGLKIGDILLKINETPIKRVVDVEKIIQDYQPEQKYIRLLINRNGKMLSVKIKPVLCSGLEDDSDLRYRLGIFIEDPAAGVGTLTFIEPNTHRFAGLGHRISHVAGKQKIPFNKGEIILADISGVKKGEPGKPGEKIGIFSASEKPIGVIEKNSQFGIYGNLSKKFQARLKAIPIAYSSQIRLGPAEIYTVIKGREVKKYQVEIIKIFRQDIPRDKGIILRVIDRELLKETGGIIQGMSGSPIIQNQKLVGAVTHVFVNDPAKGYGVLAEWMVNELKTVKERFHEKAS